MGLATAAGPGQWIVALEAESTLRDLGMRSDIIKTMHRAFTERGQDRGIADYVIDSGAAASPIIGRLVATGLHDELTGEAYAVIDGTDGRAHHVRFRGIEAFAQAPPAGGIVEVRRFGSADDPRPTLVLASRSDIDLERQVTAPGATWLDYRLVERERMPLATGGFGQEVPTPWRRGPYISQRKASPSVKGPALSCNATSSPRCVVVSSMPWAPGCPPRPDCPRRRLPAGRRSPAPIASVFH
jgi:hypothetical protein